MLLNDGSIFELATEICTYRLFINDAENLHARLCRKD